MFVITFSYGRWDSYGTENLFLVATEELAQEMVTELTKISLYLNEFEDKLRQWEHDFEKRYPFVMDPPEYVECRKRSEILSNERDTFFKENCNYDHLIPKNLPEKYLDKVREFVDAQFDLDTVEFGYEQLDVVEEE